MRRACPFPGARGGGKRLHYGRANPLARVKVNLMAVGILRHAPDEVIWLVTRSRNSLTPLQGICASPGR